MDAPLPPPIKQFLNTFCSKIEILFMNRLSVEAVLNCENSLTYMHFLTKKTRVAMT